jgi:hypothetical protein
MFNPENFLKKHAHDLDNFIQEEIKQDAIRQLYRESTPRNLSEWFYFIRSLNSLYSPGLTNALQNMGIERQKARKIVKICVWWIISGYTPSGNAQYK